MDYVDKLSINLTFETTQICKVFILLFFSKKKRSALVNIYF